MSHLIPQGERCVIRGLAVLEKGVFVGKKPIIHPGVTVDEGAVVGSGGPVLKDIELWTINVGTPDGVMGNRPRVKDTCWRSHQRVYRWGVL